MIIPAQEIRRRGIFTPFHERTVVRGRSFGLSSAGYDVRIAESMTLNPGDFRLASTLEHFDIPNDLVAYVKDKSTWIRAGLHVHNTVAEPNWRGHLTLELKNVGHDPIEVLEGDPIAQIILHKLTEATEQPYAGKYQDQAPGPQAARFEAAE
jgi:dCTP deaminase